jgi:hypothetical protein
MITYFTLWCIFLFLFTIHAQLLKIGCSGGKRGNAKNHATTSPLAGKDINAEGWHEEDRFIGEQPSNLNKPHFPFVYSSSATRVCMHITERWMKTFSNNEQSSLMTDVKNINSCLCRCAARSHHNTGAQQFCVSFKLSGALIYRTLFDLFVV